MNPNDKPDDINSFLLPPKKGQDPVQPLTKKEDLHQTAVNNPVANVIRQKISSLYGTEPDAKKESQEAVMAGSHRSKHQMVMYQLSTSGHSLAEIQTAWHNYYLALPDHEKHEVWQEFYSAYGSTVAQPQSKAPTPDPVAPPYPNVKKHPRLRHPAPPPISLPRSVADIKKQITSKVSGRRQLKAKHHIQSLMFGLATGSFVVLILLFSFFNDRFIAPFITPSRSVSATPIIVNPDSLTVDPAPKVIIPKINVEAPVVYNQTSIDDSAIQKSLEDGVVHYPITPSPGQLGNVVIIGHSSNNILNAGKYKFAFVLIKSLVIGDTFYLDKDGKRYVYKVSDKKVVPPSDVSVLGPTNRPATATLITCDPPGLSINRMIIVGDQISPDPTADTTSLTTQTATAQPTIIPGNAPSLWQHIKSWFSS